MNDELTPAVIRAAQALAQVMQALIDQLDDERLRALSDVVAAGARPGLKFVARTGSQPPEVTFMLVDAHGAEIPFARTQAVRGVQ